MEEEIILLEQKDERINCEEKKKLDLMKATLQNKDPSCKVRFHLPCYCYLRPGTTDTKFVCENVRKSRLFVLGTEGVIHLKLMGK